MRKNIVYFSIAHFYSLFFTLSLHEIDKTTFFIVLRNKFILK
jgi:hypothetical protein